MKSQHTEIQTGHTVSLNDLELLTCEGGNYQGLRDRQLAHGLHAAFESTRRGYLCTGFYVLDNEGNRELMTALGYSSAQQTRYITGQESNHERKKR
jgi:hypothetical protein